MARVKRLAPIPLLTHDGVPVAFGQAPSPPPPRLRAWRAPSGYLVDLGPTRAPVDRFAAHELPAGPWCDLHDFAALDARGVVVAAHQVTLWSIEDELGLQAYGVLRHELHEQTVRIFTMDPYRVTRAARVVVAGLRAVLDEETEELAFLEGVLEADRRRRDEAATRLLREAALRVASIPGSTDDPSLGPDYLRAQRVLTDRVLRRCSSLDDELLRVLGLWGALARAVPRPLPDALRDAVVAFVTGCRRAAFDHSAAGMPPPFAPSLHTWTPPEGARRPLLVLRSALGPLHERLLQVADGQESVDALLNAMAYQQAAAWVALAMAILASARIE